MYLKKVFIENSGAIRKLDLTLAFGDGNSPKPLILVGLNGGGKTNLLSLITDALFEAAAAHHDNVLPSQGNNRSWFRSVGGRNITVGEIGGFSLLAFDDNGKNLIYKEKAGKVKKENINNRIPADFLNEITWPEDGNYKDFSVPNERSKAIFSTGVYVCFPASRSEIPHWLNVKSQATIRFDVDPNIAMQLKNPIYVEQALDRFQQWLISLMADSRVEVILRNNNESIELHYTGDFGHSVASVRAIDIANEILRAILCN